ncbi:NAD(P)-dependent oxidoreductase [Streptomyces sp. NBC_00690]|uniref:NAD(P)-dependent oxidoreductase n=1 Tax=Streptomyces sp. NBC_00690 TaxID=2975808 RepID=UPI002E2BE0D6|nr:NAD(P)-dependent oxidoreductase [Streptomyces sp. NBC_00690]
MTSSDPIPGTVFVALPDLPDNPRAFDLLRANFSNVRVAGTRERALTELSAIGPDVSAAIVGVKEHITAGVLDSLPGLRALGSVGTGSNHLDLSALRDRGVEVITTPGVNAVSVAEHAMMMILALAKQTVAGHAAALSGEDRAGMPAPAVELRGRRAGVLGAGATARALLPLLRAFGTDPEVWTRTPDNHPDLATRPLEDLFRHSEILSIHLPLTSETKGLVGTDLLSLLPEGAMVVNTARKEIFDLARLPSVVRDRPDLRFAVDDFDLAADGTAAALGGHALLSPHIAGVTVESLAAMQESAVRGTIAALRG